jgi:hypothetical protein
MGRPRVVSIVSKDAEERTPPDEAGAKVLESYVPKGEAACSQEAKSKRPGLLQQQGQMPPAPQQQGQRPGHGGIFSSLFSKISSLFRR